MATNTVDSPATDGGPTHEERIRNAWIGRITGCMLGKPVEMLSMRQGRDALQHYLETADALPLRDYVPLVDDTLVARQYPETCRDRIDRSIPDDDINYTTLALMLIEEHGLEFTTEDVARAWLRLLPGGIVFTAEREAYVKLLTSAGMGFSFGAPAAMDLSECSDNPYNDWIGAQIRADLYGWVVPGRPELAADLAQRDAALSHRGEGVHGARAVAAMGAAIAGGEHLDAAVETALQLIPADSDCAAAMHLGRDTALAGSPAAPIHTAYDHLSPVHTVNNLALVVWGLLRGAEDFSAAIGDTVSAGWDTDCNGATVGALWGLTGREIPRVWSVPWQGRVETSLAGVGELTLDDLVQRTVAVSSAAS
ncbi:MAG: ADP-ribosylglycohydrolase family protein, partial [Actinomycetota bacterium]|nr:ADP-ribosylglycohydrolase family protein [Actinomycetota bacterium]